MQKVFSFSSELSIQAAYKLSGITKSRDEIRRGNPLWLPFIFVRVGTRPTPIVKNHPCIQQRQ